MCEHWLLIVIYYLVKYVTRKRGSCVCIATLGRLSYASPFPL